MPKWTLWSVLLVACWASPVAAQDLAHWHALGEEQPDLALAGLRAMPAPDDARLRRERLMVEGLVLAGSGRSADALALADRLQDRSDAGPARLAQAAAQLVRARVHELAGRSVQAHAALLAVREGFDEACGACDPRWRAQTELMSMLSASQAGLLAQSAWHGERALSFALASTDPALAALAEGALARLNATERRPADAQARLARAWDLWAQRPDVPVQTRLLVDEAIVHLTLADVTAARETLSRGLALARSAGLARQAAVFQINLVDLELRHGRPKSALAAATDAEPVLRRFGDLRRQRVLLHNTGLARLATGDRRRGQADLDAALRLWGQDDAPAERASAMREYAEALAAAGDLPAALAMWHRERELHQQNLRSSRESALQLLQARFERSAQQAEIDARGRQHELGESTLNNQRLQQQVWGLAALVSLLAVGLLALMWRRLRRTRGELSERQLRLREQSTRDALTGLPNRRHVQQQMAALPPGGLQGALLLLDVDHFKQVNDQCGHAGGDQVLRHLARRLSQGLRQDDLVARWGGEEFLVYLPGIAADQLLRRVQALLDAAASAPWPQGGAAAERCVTVSIGFVLLPLPPGRLVLDWEQALALADTALYRAKSGGRNRALGLSHADAADAAALQALMQDFDAAQAQGRLRTQTLHGPARAAAAQALRTRTL